MAQQGFANGRRSDVITSQCVELEWLIAIDNEAFGHVRSQADFGIMVTLPSWVSLLTHGNVKEGFVNKFVVDSNVDKVLELHGQACLIVER